MEELYDFNDRLCAADGLRLLKSLITLQFLAQGSIADVLEEDVHSLGRRKRVPRYPQSGQTFS